jgi:hypothetical protein
MSDKQTNYVTLGDPKVHGVRVAFWEDNNNHYMEVSSNSGSVSIRIEKAWARILRQLDHGSLLAVAQVAYTAGFQDGRDRGLHLN